MSNGGSYDPHAVEGEIYRFWEQGGHFRARPNPDKTPYVIDIPLPNVTGALHLGHALNNTLQDILIRHKRMAGFEALWMPGTDHAGIATQAVVERRLKEEQNLSRHELGREGLVEKIWEWKEQYGERILSQLRKMGFSCDWERTRFTLDEVCAKAVYEVFFRWFKEGLIERGVRLVNWDAHLQTAVADDEVIHETVKGHFWHYRYPILQEGNEATRQQGIEDAIGRATRDGARLSEDYLVIATTRPETMLGDTAVCVHPDDERYQHLVGKTCLLPLMNRPIPIIADGLLAKQEMGTGCVKVTPGHDPKDYDCGLRNNLPMINILTLDGKINEKGGPYAGLSVYEARRKVVEDLEKLGLMEQIEPYETEIGHSDRSKTPIEPMLSEQWFMKMGELAESAMDAVRDGRVQFFPQRYEKTYLDWLGEKRDWCISRQLWWGHRIPVWRWTSAPAFVDPGASGRLREALEKGLVVADYQIDSREQQELMTALAQGRAPSIEQVPGILKLCFCPRPKFMAEFSKLAQTLSLAQDPDVLDTWFSSALWPFSTLGWPHGEQATRQQGNKATRHEDTGRRASESSPGASMPRCLDASLPSPADLEYFYPTSTLVTARGIITLWVARMVMTGLYFRGRVPFQHVHIHPIIQDGLGRTMSKSLGNGVDPLDIIQLYGTDALRFTMAQMDTETQDVRLPVKPVKLPDGRQINSSEKFELGRNFCNKIWQAATGFVLPNLEGALDSSSAGPPSPASSRSAGPPNPASSRSAGPPGPAPSDSEVRRYYAPRPLTTKDLALEDHWILSRLAGCIAECDRRLARYQISDVATALYSFFWNDFCDWYVELVKPRLFGRNDAGEIVRNTDESARVARQVLAWVLDQALRLLHPITPFLTEALWRKLNQAAPRRGIKTLIEGEPALIRAAWPDAAAWSRDTEIEAELDALQNVIRGLRDTLAWINTTRAGAKTPAIGKLPRAVIRAAAQLVAGLHEQMPVICRLGRCEAVEIGADLAKPPESATKVFPGIEIFVPIKGLADLDVERRRLTKERDQLAGHISRLKGKLTGEGFVSKAPPAVVERERQRLVELEDKLAALERNLAEIAA